MKTGQAELAAPGASDRSGRAGAVVAFLLAAYLLGGFLVLPGLLAPRLEKFLSAQVDGDASLRELRFNPLTLAAEVRGFELRGRGGQRLIAAERLLIDVGLGSLVNRALTVEKIVLERPAVAVSRAADGRIDLLAALTAPIAPTRGAARENLPGVMSRVPLLIESMVITGGRLALTDRAAATPFNVELGPVELALANLRSVPGEAGTGQLTMALQDGARLDWRGAVQFSPLGSQGRISGSGSFLALLAPYLSQLIGPAVEGGELAFSLDYQLAAPAGATPELSLANVDASLSDLALIERDGRGGRQLVLSQAGLALDGGYLAWPARQAGADSLALTGLELSLRRDASGVFNAAGWLVGGQNSDWIRDAREQAWALTLARLEVGDARVDYIDHGLREPEVVRIAELDLSTGMLTTEPGVESPVAAAATLAGGGQFAVQGDIRLRPALAADAQLSVDALALQTLQPWLGNATRAVIGSGVASAGLDIGLAPDRTLQVGGNLLLSEVAVAEAGREGVLAGWRELAVEGLSFTAGDALELDIQTVKMARPALSLHIDEQGAVNWRRLRLDEPREQVGAKTAETSRPLEASIGVVEIDDGVLDFEDLSLPLPFHTQLRSLRGQIERLATRGGRNPDFRLDGLVGEDGCALLEGSLSLAAPDRDADVRLFVHNVPLPDLSPYALKFLGHQIADGRIGAALRYRLRDAELTARNSLVIDRFELGDGAGAAGAMELPLDLAAPLLTGPGGKVSIELPVTGDLDAPGFTVGGAVMQAFGALIAEVVASPFAVLGGLVGFDGDDFDTVEFEPGRSALASPDIRKLELLARALIARPDVRLLVPGAISIDADVAALQVLKLDAKIDQWLAARGEQTAPGGDEQPPNLRLQALEHLYREVFRGLPLDRLQRNFTLPPDGDGEARVDEDAYAADLRAALIPRQPVDSRDLSRLSRARVAAVESVLLRVEVQGRRVDAARIEAAPAAERRLAASGSVPLQMRLKS